LLVAVDPVELLVHLQPLVLVLREPMVPMAGSSRILVKAVEEEQVALPSLVESPVMLLQPVAGGHIILVIYQSMDLEMLPLLTVQPGQAILCLEVQVEPKQLL
jgi:hypothetical protein